MIVATLLMLLAGDVAAAEEALAAKEPEKALALLGTCSRNSTSL